MQSFPSAAFPPPCAGWAAAAGGIGCRCRRVRRRGVAGEMLFQFGDAGQRLRAPCAGYQPGGGSTVGKGVCRLTLGGNKRPLAHKKTGRGPASAGLPPIVIAVIFVSNSPLKIGTRKVVNTRQLRGSQVG